MKRNALVLIANGTEEMECVIVCDVLRRGGIKVTLAGVDGPDACTCSRNVVIQPDCSLDSVAGDSFDLLVLPGGAAGAKRFCESKVVLELLRKRAAERKFVACLCAAPTALAAAGVFRNSKLTSHPSVAADLALHTENYSEERVVVDDCLITSRGPVEID